MVATLSHGSEALDDEYVIDYGILEEGENGIYHVKTRTTDIPYITESQDSNFKFGYTIEKKETGFFVHTRITMPLTKNTYVNRAHDVETDNETQTVTTKNKYYLNESHELVMSLEDGDPPGLYKMEIFINDRLYKTIIFNVKK